MREPETGRGKVHFLLHVPKCAGTSVESHFRRALGSGYLHAPRWEHFMRDVIGNRYGYRRGDSRLSKVRVASGHSLSISLMKSLAPRRVEESVLLRGPISFYLSMYNYRMRRFEEGDEPKPPEFLRWYSKQRRNPVSSFLLTRYFEEGVPYLYRLSSAGRLQYLEARLPRFLFVGSYTRADELIEGVSRDLGIDYQPVKKNVSGQRYLKATELTAGMREQIIHENLLDHVLYLRWRDRGWRDGAPAEVIEDRLPTNDRMGLMMGDLAAEIGKKLSFIER